MPEIPAREDVERTKDILAVHDTLTTFKVIINDLAIDDWDTYPRLVTELADLTKARRR